MGRECHRAPPTHLVLSSPSLLLLRYETTVLIRVPYYHTSGVGKLSPPPPPPSQFAARVWLSSAESVFAGFGLKLVLNAVSTGANILKGRVYGNTMVNLTLSNDKVVRVCVS